MSSIQPVDQKRRRIKSIWTFTSLLLFVSIFSISSAAAAAEEEGSENVKEDDFWYAITHGKPTLDMRARVEIADLDNKGADGLNRSEAYTLRTRLGYGTKPWKGLMAYAEGENITAVAGGQYNDGTEPGSGKTVIADPTKTEVNQVFLNLNRKDWLDTHVTLGRQRIILDDSRFVGNVGWRQNEQTFDAVRGSTSLGVEDLNVSYAYMRYARRIFGDKDQGTTAQKDWRTNNHVVHVAYTGFDAVDVTGFAYIFEFNRAQANSSATVGFRLTGDSEITDDLKLIYERPATPFKRTTTTTRTTTMPTISWVSSNWPKATAGLSGSDTSYSAVTTATPNFGLRLPPRTNSTAGQMYS
jgi:hypothetical protein